MIKSWIVAAPAGWLTSLPTNCLKSIDLVRHRAISRLFIFVKLIKFSKFIDWPHIMKVLSDVTSTPHASLQTAPPSPGTLLHRLALTMLLLRRYRVKA